MVDRAEGNLTIAQVTRRGNASMVLMLAGAAVMGFAGAQLLMHRELMWAATFIAACLCRSIGLRSLEHWRVRLRLSEYPDIHLGVHYAELSASCSSPSCPFCGSRHEFGWCD